MPKGIPLSHEEQQARRLDIFSAAVNLFKTKGYQETSMREIAAAVGMGKSTLYDFFTSKEEILLFVLAQHTAILTNGAAEIAAQDLPPTERLRRVMRLHLEFLQENSSLFTQLIAASQRLNVNSQQSIQERRYEYQDLVKSIIDEGIHSGAFRPVDSLLAARLLVNSMLSVMFTSRPTGEAETMLSEAVDIYLNGLCA